MFIYPKEITALDLYLNPKFTSSSNWCRLRKNDMSFAIQKVDGVNIITIDYEIIFESVHNCEVVGTALFQLVTSFETTVHKDDDLIGLTHFLNETYLSAENYLKDENNIPPAMIRLTSHLISANDIAMLVDAIFLELSVQGFYS